MAKRATSAGDTPWLEWAVGAAGALFFLAIAAVLLSSALRGAEAPPSIETRVERIVAVADGFAVEIIAVNQGEVTAAQTRLVATLEQPGGEREERELTFDYLPPRSERRGGFFFTEDPRIGALTIEADGYVDP